MLLFPAVLRPCFHQFRIQSFKERHSNTVTNRIWWFHGAICLAMRAPGELFAVVDGSSGAKMGALGCPRKPKRLPRRPREHPKRMPNAEITLNRPCQRFRASQIMIYQPCQMILSADKRPKERPSRDLSALSTFQSFKVLRIRVLEGWRPPSLIQSSFFSLPSPPWGPCILILPVSRPNVTRAFGHHFCQK